MADFMIHSALRLHILKKSALPLQSQKVQQLYQRCLNDTGITKNVPIYSTAYLKSPVIVGFWKPCIYLPIRLIADDTETDIRLLHPTLPARYTTLCSDWKMTSSLLKILSSNGMEPLIPLKHGTKTRYYRQP